jgi:hypothetical protein
MQAIKKKMVSTYQATVALEPVYREFCTVNYQDMIFFKLLSGLIILCISSERRGNNIVDFIFSNLQTQKSRSKNCGLMAVLNR